MSKSLDKFPRFKYHFPSLAGKASSRREPGNGVPTPTARVNSSPTSRFI
jgi:hypothetical protein